MNDALDTRHHNTVGETGEDVGQDEGTNTQESSSPDWESQAKYFQSEKDKLYEENQRLGKYAKIGELLESRPDIVEAIKDKVDGQPKMEPLKPDEFDPWEAYNDPSSKSYQYRQQELQQAIAQGVQQQVAPVMQSVRQQNGETQIRQELANRGMTPEQQDSFIKFASMNPAEYGIDNVIKMWQTLEGTDSQQTMNAPIASSPLDQIRNTQQTPTQAGRLNGEQPINKSESDAMWDGIVGAGSRSNVL